jgi:hypothetical protein
MGQAPAAAPAPGTTSLVPDEARLVYQGLSATLAQVDQAKTTGWSCTGVSDQDFYTGRLLQDRLAKYVGGLRTADVADAQGNFVISKDETDVADKILACSNEATGSSPNKAAYFVLGTVVVGAAVFFSVAR